jgi:hypothetical protein
MAKFVLIYSGGMGMGASPEEQKKIMGDWGAWYGQMGANIADGGAPFGAAKNITADGIGDGAFGDTPATGYTVINAESLDAATQACAAHPHVKHGGQVTVFEYIDMSPPK